MHPTPNSHARPEHHLESCLMALMAIGSTHLASCLLLHTHTTCHAFGGHDSMARSDARCVKPCSALQTVVCESARWQAATEMTFLGCCFTQHMNAVTLFRKPTCLICKCSSTKRKMASGVDLGRNWPCKRQIGRNQSAIGHQSRAIGRFQTPFDRSNSQKADEWIK